MEGGLAQTQTQIMPKKGWLLLLSVLAVDGLFWLSRILSLPAKGNWERGKTKTCIVPEAAAVREEEAISEPCLSWKREGE